VLGGDGGGRKQAADDGAVSEGSMHRTSSGLLALREAFRARKVVV
jgi:hypothetical protein